MTTESTSVPATRAPAAAPPGAQLSSKNSVIFRIAERVGVTPEALQATVKATLMPAGATNEQLLSFLLVADQYRLNPFLNQLYAFAAKGGGVKPMVPIDGWIKIAQDHPQYGGFTQRYVQHEIFGHGIETEIVRKDWAKPAVHTEWLNECKGTSGPWQSHPGRMLGHKSFIQTARYAFGISGLYDEDEAERIRDIPVEVRQPAEPRAASLERRLLGDVPAAQAVDPPAPEAGADTSTPADVGPQGEREPGADEGVEAPAAAATQAALPGTAGGSRRRPGAR